MTRMLPEIIGEVFRFLQATQDYELDLIAASLVCTLWYSEARPLLDGTKALKALFLGTYESTSIVHDDKHAIDRSVNNLQRLQRLSSLLTESRHLGLNHCDLIEEIHVRPYFVEDKIQVEADLIQSIVSLAPPNLHRLQCLTGSTPSSGWITLLSRIYSQSITTLIFVSISPTYKDETAGVAALIHLLERHKDTLRNIAVEGLWISDIRDALVSCRQVSSLDLSRCKLSGITVTGEGGTVLGLAAAFPYLTGLNAGNMSIGSTQVRELVTRLPGLARLVLRVDGSFDDECLLWLARNTPGLEELEVRHGTNVQGHMVWSEGDVAWVEMKRLYLYHMRGVAPSFVDLVLRGCKRIESTFWPSYDGMTAKMEEYGFVYNRGDQRLNKLASWERSADCEL